MSRDRDLQDPIQKDLERKMVFVSGPRQVGKTTLAKQILKSSPNGLYLSWDRREDRSKIRAARWPDENPLVVLDEIHKLRHWKRWIKGEYDHHGDRVKFLVTGSARLDVYRRGGDSLQGRYHHYRLHPFTLREIEGNPSSGAFQPGGELSIPSKGARSSLESLQRFGGFPEPFLSQSQETLRRWQKERMERFFREDVRDLEQVRDLSNLQILSDLIAERVGSPLSLNNLREDLEVSHRGVSHWVEILERLYFLFRVKPFATRSVNALKKMPKAYLWDYSLVEDRAARFENLLAQHLLKFCHYHQDTAGHALDLHYLRDPHGREVDFLVTSNRKPWFAVECKLGGAEIDRSLSYFRERLKIPHCYQVSFEGKQDFVRDGIRVVEASRFLMALA